MKTPGLLSLAAMLLLLSTGGRGHIHHENEGSCEEFDTVREELVARWGIATPAGTDIKHEPVISVNGGLVTITVGNKEHHHPQIGGSHENKIHFIEYLYAVDQSNNIIAFKRLIPESDKDVWENRQLTFALPKGVTTLQAFSFCNLHGLFSSTTQNINGTSGVGHKECDRLSCTKASCGLLGTLRHESIRKVGGRAAVQTSLLNITQDTVSVTIHNISSLPGIAYADSVFFISRKSDSPIAGSLLNGIPFSHTQMLPHYAVPGKVDLFILYFDHDGQPNLVKHSQAILPGSTCPPQDGGPCAAQYRMGKVGGTHKDKCFSEAALIRRGAALVPTSGATSSHVPKVKLIGSNVIQAVVDHGMYWSKDPADLHFIDYMWAEDEFYSIIAIESWVTNLTFTVPDGVQQVRVFSACNRHGVHVSEVIEIPSPTDVESLSSSLPEVLNTNSKSDVSNFCTPLADHPFSFFVGEHPCGDQVLQVLQADGIVFDSLVFPDDKVKKKITAAATPTLSFGSFGQGNAIVRFPTRDKCINDTDVITVRSVVVVDQHMNAIAGSRYVGVERNPQLVFAVPRGAETLTVRVVYNEVGLWVGEPQKVEATCGVDLGYGCSTHIVISSDDNEVVVVVDDDDDDDDGNSVTRCTQSILSNYTCMTVSSAATIHWNLTSEQLALALQLHKPVLGYVAFAFPNEYGKMAPADSLIATTPNDDVLGYLVLDNPDRVVQDSELLNRLNITSRSISVIDGKVLMEVVRQISGGFDPSKVFINIAWSNSNPDIQTHHDEKFSFSFDFLNASVEEEKDQIYYYLHAVLMMLGFGVFIPIGVVAKYRMRRGEIPKPHTAVYTHVANVLVGLVCIDVGFFMKAGFSERHNSYIGAHDVVGYFVFFLVNTLPLFICFSNFPFVDGERSVFRDYVGTIHRYLGRLVVVFAMFQCLTGAIQMGDVSTPTAFLVGFVIVMSTMGMFYIAVVPSIKDYYPIKPEGEVAELGKKDADDDFTNAVDNIEAEEEVERA